MGRMTFAPALPDRMPPGYELPPVLDLTLGPADPAFVDETDTAMAEVVASLPAIALWRVWDLSGPSRLFLIELDCAPADVPGLTAGLNAVLLQLGADNTRIEAYAASSVPPETLLHARDNSALLWAAEATEPVRVAQAWDRIDPERGPCFDDGHERLTDPERTAVLRYFDDAPRLLSSTETMVDIVEPERGAVVPVIHRTDGRWAWTDLAPYYLRTYGLAPDPGLLAHVRANNYQVPELTHVARQRVLAELFSPA